MALSMSLSLPAINYFFPYEITNALLMFSFGMISMKDTIKFFTVKMIISIIFVVVFVIPLFQTIGYLLNEKGAHDYVSSY